MSESAAPQDAAALCSVPRERIVSVEHPCIIQNFPQGLKSLGGEQQLKHVLEHEIGDSTAPGMKGGVQPVVGVSLRPDEPFAKKLSSTVTSTANVLMKVTLPKRTGRKRKRSSTEPYSSIDGQGVNPTRSRVTATELLRRMRDNMENIQINAVGTITDTHRFRDLPDFQIQGGEAAIMRELQAHIMDPEYDKLSDFRVKPAFEDGDCEALPAPATFLPSSQYAAKRPRQPDGANATDINREPRDESLLSASRQRVPQLRDIVVNLETQPVPNGPSSDLRPPAPGSAIDHTRQKLTELLNERPLYTRRVYWSRIQERADKSIRRALIHVAYYLDSGPWRYSIVKHGIDPRSDPKYRIYQTFGYSHRAIAVIKEGPAYGHPPPHLRTFDGTRVVEPSETWQLCDLTEPLIQRIVQTENIRPHFDAKWGWYYNGTMAKIMVITREKMIALANPGRKEELGEEEYEVLANLPDVVRNAVECHLDRSTWAKHVCKLAEAIGDEAVEPTFMGIRGYDEVVPNRLTALIGGENGTVNGVGRGTGDMHEAAEEEDEDHDGEQLLSSDLPQDDDQDGDWVEGNPE